VGASYGDAFLAALAIGAEQPADIGVWNPTERIVETESDTALERNYKIFKSLYLTTKELMKQI
ncbi:MAG: carbohydrate kinase, partial [Paracoccaceae bacterium]